MSAEAKTLDEKLVRIPPTGFWAGAWKLMAVLGLAGAVGTGIAAMSDLRQVAYSWLFAFAAVWTVALGLMIFTIIQHLTGAAWSVSVRRIAEVFIGRIWVLALLFVPVALSAPTLYAEWKAAEAHHAEAAGHGAGEALLGASTARAEDAPGAAAGHAGPAAGGHAAPAAGGHGAHTPYETALHHEVLARKLGYLNTPFWVARAIVYFGVWILIGLLYFHWSTRQDTTRDPAFTVKARKAAPAAAAGFGLTLTFAAFDWIMALEPAWYSTIYGVYVFAGAFMAAHALLIVVTLSLRRHGLLGDAVNVEHYHDLGKMMFGFVVFWAYIGFSQLMLIWYANIPEELTYYHKRWVGGWKLVSLLLLFSHFVLPFVFVISRNVKRRLPLLGVAAAWMLVVHVVDLYWFVMPYAHPGAFAPHWADVAALAAVAGIYLAAVFFELRRHPLVPVGDPLLGRCLGHVNH